MLQNSCQSLPFFHNHNFNFNEDQYLINAPYQIRFFFLGKNKRTFAYQVIQREKTLFSLSGNSGIFQNGVSSNPTEDIYRHPYLLCNIQ